MTDRPDALAPLLDHDFVDALAAAEQQIERLTLSSDLLSRSKLAEQEATLARLTATLEKAAINHKVLTAKVAAQAQEIATLKAERDNYSSRLLDYVDALAASLQRREDESPVLAFQAWLTRYTQALGRKVTQNEYALLQAGFFAAHPGNGPTSTFSTTPQAYA
jgi:septal ring factor EnvC (AmiA/AmiB activator)